VTYRVELTRQAEKTLDRLDRATEKRLRDRLKELSSSPYDPRLSDGVIMEADKRYSRVGVWRVIYRVESQGKIIFVTAIQHRSKAYRK
jgi:mRNA interferase RelE/StbE